MERAHCNHEPRVLVPNGAKHKDGTSVMICATCKADWSRRWKRKRDGWQAFWDAQHGLCALCGQPLTDDRNTHLDHNHVTGRKRGLVHVQCNQMLGGIENAIALIGLDKLVQYLRPERRACITGAPRASHPRPGQQVDGHT